MLQAAIRAATRPAARATRATLRPTQISNRTFSTTVLRRSSDPHHVDAHGHVDAHAPGLFGVGSEPGKISTDEEQATGLERLELLGEMQGVSVFDEEPLDSSRLGTLDNPIRVFSLDTQRIIGCTGSPADSHDLHWINLDDKRDRRCPECGSVYHLDFQGDRELLAAQDAAHH